MEEKTKEKKTFIQKFKALFTKEKEEDPHYERKLMDKKIDRYLDANFESYLKEYGILTEMDLVKYDEKHGILNNRVVSLRNFVQDAGATIGSMEIRLEGIKKGMKTTASTKGRKA